VVSSAAQVQTGFVQSYALLMVIGLLAFFIVYLSEMTLRRRRAKGAT
jgi:hypothetical protein